MDFANVSAWTLLGLSLGLLALPRMVGGESTRTDPAARLANAHMLAEYFE